MSESKNGLKYVESLVSSGTEYGYFSLAKAAREGRINIESLPFSIRILFEAVLRNLNGKEVNDEHVRAFSDYNPASPSDIEFPFMPARVLLQDFTGVPCVVDLAAMRSAVQRMGGDPTRINPQLPVNLVVDHSVNVDFFNAPDAMRRNTELEFSRNHERYEFLRWGQASLKNFSVVPPASGICHQVNLEYLAKVVQTREISGRQIAYFDTLVGTDSHTTMINGLGVLGWGVGGIEAEAAMLGQPIYMLLPPVVGLKLLGSLAAGVTSTDLVLRITELLRSQGVVNKIVEFFGPGIENMSVPDRATVANMAPEYGATAGYFPIDSHTLRYLHQTGRSEALIRLVEDYARAQGLFLTRDTPTPQFQAAYELDLASIKPSISGPKRPQDRQNLEDVPRLWNEGLAAPVDKKAGYAVADDGKRFATKSADGEAITLGHGDVVIASITSCTNTSSPALLIGAGLLAKKAVERGLTRKPHVKTSFAPGSVVVTEYLKKAGLLPYLEKLGFYLVGYGCTTCIGNSGPLPPDIGKTIEDNKLVVAAVLSGNRNFEGRVNPGTRANFLASPPLCVAYAIAGTMKLNLSDEPLGTDRDGKPVYLSEIWPSESELAEYVSRALDRETFIQAYSGIEASNAEWNDLGAEVSNVYKWKDDSTYIQEPPFFRELKLSDQTKPISPLRDAYCLAWFGDSITTDHISPAGSISRKSPAAIYLQDHGISIDNFNSYGSRRGNDRVMTRGTFANIRLRNLLVPDTEGGVTKFLPEGRTMSIYEAAQSYAESGRALVILAGKDYGMGSSRDWAAKGVQLLGVRAVIAESFERIHRSNLVGMGVLPLQFLEGQSAATLGLNGEELFSIEIDESVQAKQEVNVSAQSADGSVKNFKARVRIDSSVEKTYYRNGGILQTVLRQVLAN